MKHKIEDDDKLGIMFLIIPLMFGLIYYFNIFDIQKEAKPLTDKFMMNEGITYNPNNSSTWPQSRSTGDTSHYESKPILSDYEKGIIIGWLIFPH